MITGKVRLAKWFQTLPSKTKAKIVKDVTQLVLARRTRMCNFLEYKGKCDCSRDARWLGVRHMRQMTRQTLSALELHCVEMHG